MLEGIYCGGNDMENRSGDALGGNRQLVYKMVFFFFYNSNTSPFPNEKQQQRTMPIYRRNGEIGVRSAEFIAGRRSNEKETPDLRWMMVQLSSRVDASKTCKPSDCTLPSPITKEEPQEFSRKIHTAGRCTGGPIISHYWSSMKQV